MTKTMRVALALAATLGQAPIALAQSFPSRPVTLVVPFAASGPTDTLARIMADPMKRTLGQAVVIENVTGAGGSIGVGRVARAVPDGYTVSISNGGSHLSGIYFQNVTGTKFQFVPYRGAGPALQDLMAGHIDLMFDQASNSLPHLRAGKIRAYAVTARTHLAAAPEVPTVDEAGMPGFYTEVWHGVWVPRGTPPNVIGKLNVAIVDTLADLRVRQRLVDLGQDIPPRERQTPEALRAHYKAETEKWWPMIKAAGIKAE